MNRRLDLLTLSEAAEELRFTVTNKDPEKGVRKFCKRKNVQLWRRGRTTLVSLADLRAAMLPQPRASRRAS